jgi:hypothetical protein
MNRACGRKLLAAALTLSLLPAAVAQAQTSCPPDAQTVSAALIAGGARLGSSEKAIVVSRLP